MLQCALKCVFKNTHQPCFYVYGVKTLDVANGIVYKIHIHYTKKADKLKIFIKEAEAKLSKSLLAMRKGARAANKQKPTRAYFAKKLGITPSSLQQYETKHSRVSYVPALALISLYEGRKNIDPLGEDLKIKLSALEGILNDTQTKLAEGMVLLQTCGDPGYPHGLNDDDKE